MPVRFTLPALSLLLAFKTATAQDLHSSARDIHEVYLNKLASSEPGAKKKNRITLERAMTHLQLPDTGALYRADSAYLVTRFPAPTEKRFRITALESPIDDFDTSRLSLCFVVIQLQNGDTVFREFPIQPAPGTKGSKRWTRHEIRGAGVSLHAAPFYLGYICRLKPGVEKYDYHSYAASSGGEGGYFSIWNGSWKLTRSPFYQILPFRISYAEL